MMDCAVRNGSKVKMKERLEAIRDLFQEKMYNIHENWNKIMFTCNCLTFFTLTYALHNLETAVKNGKN